MKSNVIFVKFHTRFQSTEARDQMRRLSSLSHGASATAFVLVPYKIMNIHLDRIYRIIRVF